MIIDNDFWEEPAIPKQPEHFHICDENSANWLLRKLGNIEAEKARIHAQAETLLQQLDGDRKALEGLYLQQLETYARQTLSDKGNKRRSLTLLQGTCGFRIVKGGLRLTDEAAALVYAQEMATDAVKVKVVERLDTTRYRELAQFHLITTGELLPGAEVTEDRETFSVSV